MVEVSYDLLHTTFQILRQKQDNAKKRRTPLCKYRSPLSLALLPYDLCLTTVSSLQTPHGCCLAPPPPSPHLSLLHYTALSAPCTVCGRVRLCVRVCGCVCCRYGKTKDMGEFKKARRSNPLTSLSISVLLYLSASCLFLLGCLCLSVVMPLSARMSVCICSPGPLGLSPSPPWKPMSLNRFAIVSGISLSLSLSLPCSLSLSRRTIWRWSPRHTRTHPFVYSSGLSSLSSPLSLYR